MKAYDKVKKTELDLTREQLIELMQNNRQVELVLPAEKTDADGYLTWDTEYWTSLDPRRFVRYYSLRGRHLRDTTAHNIYDIKTDFLPEQAKEVFIG